MSEEIHLKDPDGNPWVAGSAMEANDLCCAGYTRVDKPAKAAKESPSPSPTKAGSE